MTSIDWLLVGFLSLWLPVSIDNMSLFRTKKTKGNDSMRMHLLLLIKKKREEKRMHLMTVSYLGKTSEYVIMLCHFLIAGTLIQLGNFSFKFYLLINTFVFEIQMTGSITLMRNFLMPADIRILFLLLHRWLAA